MCFSLCRTHRVLFRVYQSIIKKRKLENVHSLVISWAHLDSLVKFETILLFTILGTAARVVFACR